MITFAKINYKEFVDQNYFLFELNFLLSKTYAVATIIIFVSFLFFILVDLDNVEGIAVDWIGNNLYWTNDGHRKTINVARLEKASQSRKTLLEGEMSHPRGIVVDPVNG